MNFAFAELDPGYNGFAVADQPHDYNAVFGSETSQMKVAVNFCQNYHQNMETYYDKRGEIGKFHG